MPRKAHARESHNLKAPEEVQDMNFFFTLTIKPEFNHLTYRAQYRKSANDALDLIIAISQKYRMSVEISPKNGHIHYHGIMKIPLNDFSADSMRLIFIDNARNKKSLGFCQIDLIKDIDDSYDYITKELNETEAIINRDPNKCKLPIYFKNEIKYTSFNTKMIQKRHNPVDKISRIRLDKQTPDDPFYEMDCRAREITKYVDDVLEECKPFIEDHLMYKIMLSQFKYDYDKAIIHHDPNDGENDYEYNYRKKWGEHYDI